LTTVGLRERKESSWSSSREALREWRLEEVGGEPGVGGGGVADSLGESKKDELREEVEEPSFLWPFRQPIDPSSITFLTGSTILGAFSSMLLSLEVERSLLCLPLLNALSSSSRSMNFLSSLLDLELIVPPPWILLELELVLRGDDTSEEEGGRGRGGVAGAGDAARQEVTKMSLREEEEDVEAGMEGPLLGLIEVEEEGRRGDWGGETVDSDSTRGGMER
jgi:hypothetical protein